MTNEEAILLIDPEQTLLELWIDEDEEVDDYVPAPRNRHILSAEEWDAILDKKC